MSEVNGRTGAHWSLTASQVLVALVLAGMVYVMHQMYWPVTVMDVTKVEVLTPTVMAGERVKIRFTVEKYLMVPMVIQRTLVNETTTTYVEEHGSQPLGKSIKTIELLIPKDKHEGKYHITSTVVARANHFRTWQKTWETPFFWVFNPESQNTEKIKDMQKDIDKMGKEIKASNNKLRGPQGPKGDIGEKGATGATGMTGGKK